MSLADHDYKTLADLAKHGGHVTINAQGGVGCSFENTSITNMHPAFADEAIARGILVLDVRTADYSDLCRVVFRGPMLARGHCKPDNPIRYDALAYIPLEPWLAMRRAIGVTIHNDPFPAHHRAPAYQESLSL